MTRLLVVLVKVVVGSVLEGDYVARGGGVLKVTKKKKGQTSN